jgi:predicted metalloprotease
MDFDKDAQLDSSQVEDARGRSVSGGAMAAGGGAAGIIALIAALFFGVDLTGGSGTTAQQQAQQQPAGTSNLAAQCRTGADANQSADCRIVGTVNSIQQYWKQTLGGYTPARTQLFSQATTTACGRATSAVGPFYCPRDKKVYLDLTFFNELQQKFGASGGPFAQAYVVGHEYGHHVQNLMGTMAKYQTGDSGAGSASVRLELQADCYAGTWARNAVSTGFFSAPFSDEDIREALSAAEAVGDDRIQQRTQGYVQPDGFTHGSSAQRERWFTTGYQTGDPRNCDTFSGSI